MKPSELTAKLAALQKQMNNRSPKPSKRLQASIAYHDYQRLRASLPGSTRRGLERGHLV